MLELTITYRNNRIQFRIIRSGKKGNRWIWTLRDDALHMRVRDRHSGRPIRLLLTKYKSKCLDYWRPLSHDRPGN